MKRLTTKSLVVLLTVAMTLGTTPTWMWAEGAEATAETATSAAEATVGESTGPAAAEASTGESAAATTDNAASDAAAAASESAAVETTATQQASTSSSATAATTESQPTTTSASLATSQQAAYAVRIQDAKDKGFTEEVTSGAVSAGTVLWANVYDGTTGTVPGDADSCTYEWFAADRASSSAADYTQSVGTERSLTVSADLAGKYLICKVTVAGGEHVAPATTDAASVDTDKLPVVQDETAKDADSGDASAAAQPNASDGQGTTTSDGADAQATEVPSISVKCAVIGADADGSSQTWAATQTVEMKEGDTAATLSERFFALNGLAADYDPDYAWGWYLKSISSPFDSSLKLEYDSATGKYWQLFINGESSAVGASGYTLKEGDSVVWCYSGWGDTVPEDTISATCSIIGLDAEGNQQQWGQPVTLDLKKGTLASDLSEQAFEKNGIAAECGESTWGWYLSTLTSPFESKVKLGSAKDENDNWSYWQLFINGEYASVGAGSYELQDGDTVQWVYGSDGTAVDQMQVSFRVIGLDSTDGNGKAQEWASTASYAVPAGISLGDATWAYLDEQGFEWGYVNDGDTRTLVAITSPFDSSVELSLGWTCFVNGKEQDDDDYELKAGDQVVWAFNAQDGIPDTDSVTIDPSASRPDWTADWPGYADGGSGSATTSAATPTEGAAAAWTFDYSRYGSSASEPVIVNGFVYLATGKKLLKIDSSTGKVVASSNLVASIDYTCRPVYAQGLVMVPLSGGRVQALTADALITVWATDAVSSSAQASSTLTVDGVYLNVSTVDIDWNTSTYNNGYFVRINMATGAIAWSHHEADEGYYWNGTAVTGNYLVTVTSAGTLQVLDKSSGSVVSSVSLGAVVNSDPVVSDDGDRVYTVSRDGKLHVTAFDAATGALGPDSTVSLGLSGSACAPTLVDGKLIVGGELSGSSALAIVDLKTMDTQLVGSADGSALPSGGIKGAPLVSTQTDGTYVYFTVNNGATTDWINYTAGGGVYRYKLGDTEATSIYDATGHNQYCDSSVVSDAQGALYYINDSGTLFKLTGGYRVSFDSAGGSTVVDQNVLAGALATKPSDPVRDGYTFEGWYTDEACTAAFSFGTPIKANTALYAKWQKKPSDDSKNDSGATSDDNNGNQSGSTAGTSASKKAPSSKRKASLSGALKSKGSAKASTKKKVATTKATTKKSTKKKATKKKAVKNSLLKGYSSTSAASKSKKAATVDSSQADEAASAASQLPIWPFVGMVLGAGALILVLVQRRRDTDGE